MILVAYVKLSSRSWIGFEKIDHITSLLKEAEMADDSHVEIKLFTKQLQ